ncbi:MAG: hypothetical protein ACMXYM_01295 [Candidatus Woesearchaeota archaeon]
MSINDTLLRALYDVSPTPYQGMTLGQVADVIAPALPSALRVGSHPKLGIVSKGLGELVEEGFVSEDLEPRIGADQYALPVVTY